MCEEALQLFCAKYNTYFTNPNARKKRSFGGFQQQLHRLLQQVPEWLCQRIEQRLGQQLQPQWLYMACSRDVCGDEAQTTLGTLAVTQGTPVRGHVMGHGAPV